MRKLKKQLAEANIIMAKLIEQNDKLKKSNNSYKNILKRYAIKSRSLKSRKEHGIASNLLTITGNESFAGAINNELKKHLDKVQTNVDIKDDVVDIDSPEFKDLWF